MGPSKSLMAGSVEPDGGSGSGRRGAGLDSTDAGGFVQIRALPFFKALLRASFHSPTPIHCREGSERAGDDRCCY